MNKKQKGFAHLETLLILIVVLLIGFIGWFVWHTKQQADKSLDSAANTNQLVASSKKKSGTNSQPVSGAKKTTVAKQPPAAVINYSTADNSGGVQISGDNDVDKLDGASDSFKGFVKQKFDKDSHNASPCGNAYGLFVKQIYKDDFAVGTEKQCNNTNKLWAKISGNWTEIAASQTGFDCSVLEQYKVPSAIVSQCIKNGQVVSNTQD